MDQVQKKGGRGGKGRGEANLHHEHSSSGKKYLDFAGEGLEGLGASVWLVGRLGALGLTCLRVTSNQLLCLRGACVLSVVLWCCGAVGPRDLSRLQSRHPRLPGTALHQRFQVQATQSPAKPGLTMPMPKNHQGTFSQPSITNVNCIHKVLFFFFFQLMCHSNPRLDSCLLPLPSPSSNHHLIDIACILGT